MSLKKLIDADLLDYFLTKLKALIPTKTSELTNDSGFITSAPSPSSTTPAMNGSAAVGAETAYARGDHVHPTDTSRAAAGDLTTHINDINNPHSVTAAQIGAVDKTGDTMTGVLTIKDDTFDSSATLSESYWGLGHNLQILDSNDTDMGHIRPFMQTNGNRGFYLETDRIINGTTYQNALRLAIDNNGNRKVLLSADPWMEALGAVSKSGDMMTGSLRFQSSNITDEVTPSSNAWGTGVSGRDSSGDFILTQIQPVDYSSGSKVLYLARRATYTGTTKTHSLQVGFDASGNNKVWLDASAWMEALSAVSKSGDTMTGDLTIVTDGTTPHLYIKNTAIDTAASSISAARYSGVYMFDKNNRFSGYVETSQTTNGDTHLNMYARRRNADNTGNVQNGIVLGVKQNGEQSVNLSAPAAWRDAIGLKVSSKTLSSQTTNANGNFSLGLTTSNAAVLGSTTTSTSSYICTPFVYSNTWYVRVTNHSGARVTSTNIGNITVYYIAL